MVKRYKGADRMSQPTIEKFSGSLIGQALGDALGFPVEGYVPEVCAAYAARIRSALKEEDGVGTLFGRSPFPFGQYTDDTQLARDLACSIADLGRFDPANYASRISAIFKEGRIVGRGKATEAAAKRLKEGTPWTDSGTPAPSAGNGSAMRAGPIGLFFHDDPKGLVKAATEPSTITHLDPRCSAGAVAIAGAVAAALTTEKVDAPPFIEALAELTSGVDEDFTRSLRELPAWVELPPEEAAGHISKTGEPIAMDERMGGISPFVVPSVLWSLYSFLRTPEDYMETVFNSIGVGGDVDTTAAMAGAISGAYLGVASVPPKLASMVTDRDTWGAEELKKLAERLFELKGERR